MDRLLLLRLEGIACHAEAWLNGIPLARISPSQPMAMLPVHEFTLSGANQLGLVIEPGAPGLPKSPEPEPRLSDGHSAASLRLLLPRLGALAHPGSARTVAQIDWAPPADQVEDMPLTLSRSVDLPIAFPRWRWVDLQPVAEHPRLAAEIAAWLLPIAIGLRRGDAEPLIQAARLRLEELAQAYGQDLAAATQRLRSDVQRLHAQQPLQPVLPAAGKLLLRRVAGGRLLECLNPDGQPALSSPLPDGGHVGWPLRVGLIDGRPYALR
jgi:hypothetical protein